MDKMDQTELLEMGEAVFAEIERVEKFATPGPWYVRWYDDESCTNGYAVSTFDAGGAHEEGLYPEVWPARDMIASTLAQWPREVGPSEGSPSANSVLIALMRNQAKELVRLARIGWQVEQEKA